MPAATSGVPSTGLSSSLARPEPAGYRRPRTLVMVVVTALLATLGTVWASAPAQAAAYTFLINTLVANGDDTSPGDGVCKTAAGTCSLRAALQEANALPADAKITIGPAADVDSATAGVQASGKITADAGKTDNRMYSGTLTSQGDIYAYFMATRAMDIDFQNRLGIESLNDAYGATALYINGPDVHVRNFNNITSNESSITVGANGDRAIIENGAVVDPTAFITERCVALTNGADNVTIRNMTFGAVYNVGYGCIYIESGATVNDLTIERSKFYHPYSTTSNPGIGTAVGGATLNRLRVVGNTFDGFKAGATPVDLRYAKLTDSVITGNTFTNMAGSWSSIYFGKVATNTVVSKNRFTTTPGVLAGYPIYFATLSLGATADSGYTIQDNYFAGFSVYTNIYLPLGVGIVRLERNTFGPKSFGGAGDADEHNTNNQVYLVGLTANQWIRPWYPTAVNYNSTACTIDVALTAPATYTPKGPVTIDLYYTAADDAEVYLGRQTGITTSPTTITVPYGQGVGKIRSQTIAANGSSSQYSRTIDQTLPDTCAPRVIIDQAVSQEDPTSIRDIYFDVEVSETVAEDLTVEDIDMSGSTAPGARVTNVERTSESSFRVTANANGSGTIVAKVLAGALKDDEGNASRASTSTDNSVTYVTPLTIDPTSVTVTENGPSVNYTVTSSIAAMETITITATPDHPEWVSTEPAALAIPTTAMDGEIAVTAVDDALINGTRQASIAHVVSSEDPNFDGLTLPAVAVTVLDDDVADLSKSTLTTTPAGPVIADGTSAYTATATIRNTSGLGAAGVTVTFTGSTDAILSAPSCVTGTNGTCTITVASTMVGTVDLVAKMGDDTLPGSPATLEFTTGPASARHSVITAGTTTYDDAAMSSTPVTVTLFDAYGHRITRSGAAVSLTANAGELVDVRDNGDGTYSATLLAPTSAESVTVNYQVNSVDAADSVTVTLEPGVASPATSTIAAYPTTLTADGASTSVITVTLMDAQGTRLRSGGDAVTVATTGGTVGAVTDNGDGTYSATLTSPTKAGTGQVSFSVNGIAGANTADVAFTAGQPDPAKSTIVATPASITADGISTSALTVTLLDAFGNQVTGDHAVTMAASSGTVGAVTKSSDGVYTATLTSATTVGTSTVSFTVNGSNGTSKASVQFVVGAPSAATSTIAANPGAIIADGVTTSTITVTLRDANNNPITTGGATVTMSTDLGALGTVTDNGDGTYTATLTSAAENGEATITFTVDALASPNTALVRFINGPDPDITIAVEAFRANDTTYALPIPAGERVPTGTSIVWRYTVTNTGNVALSNLGIKDSQTRTTAGVPTTEEVTINCAQSTLAPDQKAVCTGTGTM